MDRQIQSESWRGWLSILPFVVALHNLEEYLGFQAYASRRGLHLTRPQLRIALSLATVLPLLLVLSARHSPKQSRRLVAGFLVPAIFASNAVSHLGQTIALHDYSPGTLTAVGLNIPCALILYRQALRSDALTPRQVRQTLVWGSLLMAPSALVLQGIGSLGARLLAYKRSER